MVAIGREGDPRVLRTVMVVSLRKYGGELVIPVL
jgi:hypothetical protein